MNIKDVELFLAPELQKEREKSMNTKIINGREVKYLDVIHHSTTGKLDLWSRIKMLFGKKITFTVEIYTQHEHCIVVGAIPNAHVERVFKRKSIGMCDTPFSEKDISKN